jgi:D-alanine-D-alanine ligase
LRIGIAFDLAPAVRPADGPDDRFEEFDKPETVAAIAAVLRGEGHEVDLLGDGRALLARLLDDPPDLVWNIAEGEGVGRCRESRVPAVLEMLGIPYTGSDPLTLALSLDKPLAKSVVAPVAVPRGLAVGPEWDRDEIRARLAGGACGPGPWFVKPALEGSSKGIRQRSLVDTPAAAAALGVELAQTYQQTVLVEEFVAGDEVTVGLVGNGPGLEVLGVMQVRPRSGDPRFVYSLEVKRDWDDRVVYETPARLPADVLDRVERSARLAYEAVGCRDVARIDFRVRDGVPYFLEANPLPGLAPDWSDLVLLAKGVGVSHAELIRRILRAAVARLGLDGERRGGLVA